MGNARHIDSAVVLSSIVAAIDTLPDVIRIRLI
jgi:hypothetical protein